MGPPSYMPSVADRNVVMRRIPVFMVGHANVCLILWRECLGKNWASVHEFPEISKVNRGEDQPRMDNYIRCPTSGYKSSTDANVKYATSSCGILRQLSLFTHHAVSTHPVKLCHLYCSARISNWSLPVSVSLPRVLHEPPTSFPLIWSA